MPCRGPYAIATDEPGLTAEIDSKVVTAAAATAIRQLGANSSYLRDDSRTTGNPGMYMTDCTAGIGNGHLWSLPITVPTMNHELIVLDVVAGDRVVVRADDTSYRAEALVDNAATGVFRRIDNGVMTEIATKFSITGGHFSTPFIPFVARGLYFLPGDGINDAIVSWARPNHTYHVGHAWFNETTGVYGAIGWGQKTMGATAQSAGNLGEGNPNAIAIPNGVTPTQDVNAFPAPTITVTDHSTNVGWYNVDTPDATPAGADGLISFIMYDNDPLTDADYLAEPRAHLIVPGAQAAGIAAGMKLVARHNCLKVDDDMRSARVWGIAERCLQPLDYPQNNVTEARSGEFIVDPGDIPHTQTSHIRRITIPPETTNEKVAQIFFHAGPLDLGRISPTLNKPLLFRTSIKVNQACTIKYGMALDSTIVDFDTINIPGPGTYVLDQTASQTVQLTGTQVGGAEVRVESTVGFASDLIVDVGYCAVTEDNAGFMAPTDAERQLFGTANTVVRFHELIKDHHRGGKPSMSFEGYLEPGIGTSFGTLHSQLAFIRDLDGTKSPWIQLEPHIRASEIPHLMEWYGGAAGSGPWADKRVANGQAAPWKSIFPKMFFEFGNEGWNNLLDFRFRDAMTDQVTLAEYDSGQTFGKELEMLIGAIEASPHINPGDVDHVLGGRANNSGWNNGVAAQVSPRAGVNIYLSLAHYLRGLDNGETRPAWPSVGEMQKILTSDDNTLQAPRADLKASADLYGHKAIVYEAGMGYVLNGLNDGVVRTTEVFLQQQISTSYGAAAAIADASFSTMRSGLAAYNFFLAKAGYYWSGMARTLEGGGIYPTWQLAHKILEKMGGDVTYLPCDVVNAEQMTIPDIQGDPLTVNTTSAHGVKLAAAGEQILFMFNKSATASKTVEVATNWASVATLESIQTGADMFQHNSDLPGLSKDLGTMAILNGPFPIGATSITVSGVTWNMDPNRVGAHTLTLNGQTVGVTSAVRADPDVAGIDRVDAWDVVIDTALTVQAETSDPVVDSAVVNGYGPDPDCVVIDMDWVTETIPSDLGVISKTLAPGQCIAFYATGIVTTSAPVIPADPAITAIESAGGALYDIREADAVFSDLAGATAAVVDAEVGQIQPITSTGGAPTAPSTATRPHLRETGGVRHLSFEAAGSALAVTPAVGADVTYWIATTDGISFSVGHNWSGAEIEVPKAKIIGWGWVPAALSAGDRQAVVDYYGVSDLGNWDMLMVARTTQQQWLTVATGDASDWTVDWGDGSAQGTFTSSTGAVQAHTPAIADAVIKIKSTGPIIRLSSAFNSLSYGTSQIDRSITNHLNTSANADISGSVADIANTLAVLNLGNGARLFGDVGDTPTGAINLLMGGTSSLSGSLDDLAGSVTYLSLMGPHTVTPGSAIWRTGNMQYILVEAGWSTAQVDQMLQNAAAVVNWVAPRTVDLGGGGNAARSAASDADVATLESKSVTVTA